MNMKSKVKNLHPLEPVGKICLILVMLVLLGSCSEDAENTESGRLSMKMTDAPFPTDLVAEANITINKIEIRKTGETEGSPFIILSEEEASFNLLDLTNGVTTTLVDLEVPVGSYDLIRLYISDASVKLSDGTDYELMVPSGAQTGLKLFIDPAIEVAGGLTADLLLDFDVSRSFVPKGNLASPAGISGFNLKPTIKVSNLSTAGQLSGVVTDTLSNGLEGVTLSIYAADTLNTSTFSAENGSYALLGLTAGSYTLVAEHEGYTAVTIEDVQIVAGNATTQDVELEEEE